MNVTDGVHGVMMWILVFDKWNLVFCADTIQETIVNDTRKFIVYNVILPVDFLSISYVQGIALHDFLMFFKLSYNAE